MAVQHGYIVESPTDSTVDSPLKKQRRRDSDGHQPVWQHQAQTHCTVQGIPGCVVSCKKDISINFDETTGAVFGKVSVELSTTAYGRTHQSSTSCTTLVIKEATTSFQQTGTGTGLQRQHGLSFGSDEEADDRLGPSTSCTAVATDTQSTTSIAESELQHALALATSENCPNISPDPQQHQRPAALEANWSCFTFTDVWRDHWSCHYLNVQYIQLVWFRHCDILPSWGGCRRTFGTRRWKKHIPLW